ncbi:MAG: polyribonucleotide nucleotidyltransferase, partial [Planctomycetes bacterium]|nr:polyribonucleotide nucleotidyltransferase [Planctomycetota bacterium]
SQVLSADRENDPDVLAAVASFAALALSSLPHGRTLGMVRIGLVDDKLVVNPLWSQSQSESCKLNLTVAGHSDAIVMVEAGAKEVGESKMIEALEMAREVAREIVDMIEELRAKAGKPKMEFTPPQVDAKVATAIDKQFGKALREAPLTLGPKQVRGAAIKAARDEAKAAFPAPAGSSDTEAKVWDTMVSGIITKIVKQSERDSILSGRRADGRDSQTIRPITIEVGVLPCTHGSVLFTRGETQALAVVTLAGTDAQQIIDGLMPEPRKRFLLHYSFPPFSVGETKRVLAPGRREIGHGALAERGLEPVLPAKDEFAYTIRVTSEILESNGSSSMATACGGTLAMMDAGVPIKQPVAGIAMGLVMEGKKYTVLSDILGSEDGCGDMDFKVVGTGRGITALQMDIKCEGLTREILAEALEQARQGRLHILREMLKAIKKPRAQLSPNAPRLVSVQVPADKIGMIIGPGGKNIRNLQEQYECKIAIEDSGLCTITGLNGEKVDACLEYIGAMTAEVELGSVYTGRVTAIKEFGAFVEILPGQEGLVHVSELSHEFIKAVTDVVRIGDEVKVKVIAIDDFGKIKLSRKALLEGGGADSGGGGRGGDEERERRPRRENDDRPARADREDRPARDDRPVRAGHHDRGDRPARGGRPEREDRPRRD